jgi:type I restriction enzyme S subunit
MAEKVEFYKETEFKDTEIGRIPKEWEVARFNNIINTLYGFAFVSEFFSEERGIPLIRIRDLGKNNTEAFYTGPYEEQYLVKRGDILVSMDGEFNVSLWRGPSGLLNQRVMKIWPRCEEKLDVLYLYYASQKTLKSFEDQIGATTVKHLLTDHLQLIKIPLPSLQEQQKIAEILSTVDESIQKTDDIIAKTERLKKGLMQELLTKGIGHKEFKYTEIGRIPKDWKVVKLEEITTKIKDIDHKMPKKQKIGIPFVSIKCMLKYPDFNFYLDPNDPDLEFISKEEYEYHVQRFDVERGDIIYSRFGSIGNAKLVTTEQPFIASYSIVLIKPNRHKVNLTFLTYILNSETVRKQAKIATKGATNRNLHLKDIKNLRVPLLSLFEQQKIAEILSTVDEKIEILKQEKVKLERIKQWFMGELLSGRIRVRVA